MQKVVVTLVFVVLCSGLVSGEENVPDSQPIRRVWIDLREHISLTLPQRHDLEEEVARIWDRYDVRVIWRAEPPRLVDSRDLAVLVWVDDDANELPSRNALGTVVYMPRSGYFRQTIFVSPRAIRYLFHRTDPSLDERVFDGQMGRALARVVAHELGHLLLATVDHAPLGLMKPSFTRRDLLAESGQHLTLPPALAAALPRTSATAGGQGSTALR